MKYRRRMVIAALCSIFLFALIKSLDYHPPYVPVSGGGGGTVTKSSTTRDATIIPTECRNCLIFVESKYCTNPEAVATSHYLVKKVVILKTGVKIELVYDNKTSEYERYGNSIPFLTVVMTADTHKRVHVKIVDNEEQRWQIPEWLVPVPDDPFEMPLYSLYYVQFSSVIGKPFHFAVIRRHDGDIVFDTCSRRSLYFADQFISISTQLPQDYNIYGLGEHVVPSLNLPQRTYTLWNYDTQTPKYNNICYTPFGGVYVNLDTEGEARDGSHPFYLDHRPSGLSHGVFLRNSNGMDVILDKNSLTYNVLGGILDFYIFLGPKPELVIQQYQEVIGAPKLPPYWGLGFHQCRYGYKNVKELETVVNRFHEESIPLDTMWTDIDYMDNYKDFTLHPINFPESEMKQFVHNLHKNGQHYVVIVDPGIKVDDHYEPYSNGLQMDIFIKTGKGEVFKGKVWPGATAFPDFMNPRTSDYWETELTKFHKLIPIDGIWLDMNELSNFHNGDVYDIQTKSQLNSPYYKINNQGDHVPLTKKTLSPDAVHHDGLLEYNVHNLYGHAETMVTNKIIEKITNKRSFIITRSTFSGTGSHGGHWTGDNHATWEDLGQSVIDILNFQLYGIPLVGADICGFSGDTTEELCARWMALGAFYPFSRSHSKQTAIPQEPYLWESVATVSRKVLAIRYSLLPHYYTLFYKVSIVTDNSLPSATVWRPLFFEFPHDPKTFNLHNQFMIGNSLLVTPVLTKGATYVDVYFPNSTWYDYYTFKKVSDGFETQSLYTPLDHIQIHIRDGCILPTQTPSLTTKASRRNNLKLIVALDNVGFAYGELYWDDGQSIDNQNNYLLVHFIATTATSLAAEIYETQYTGTLPVLDTVTVLGMKSAPVSVTVDGVDHNIFNYDISTNILKIHDLALSININFIIHWK